MKWKERVESKNAVSHSAILSHDYSNSFRITSGAISLMSDNCFGVCCLFRSRKHHHFRLPVHHRHHDHHFKSHSSREADALNLHKNAVTCSAARSTFKLPPLSSSLRPLFRPTKHLKHLIHRHLHRSKVERFRAPKPQITS
jgi:hypothetical protein